MNIGNALGSILGLAPVLGAGIYNLRKNRGERGELENIQRHGAAGARAADQITADASRTAMGVASGTGGASGGLNLLTGLRAGENARAQGAGRAATIAATESAAATRALHNDELARRQGIMELAGAAANILPTLSASALAAKDRAPRNTPVTPEQVAADPSQLGQFFEENPIPDATLQSPFLDSMDAQDAALLDEAYANDFEDGVDQPGETPNPPTQQDISNSGYDGDDEAFETSPAPNEDPVKTRVYAVTQSPEYESLRAAGQSHEQALLAIDPAAARAAAIQQQRQLPGTGTGMTLEGPK